MINLPSLTTASAIAATIAGLVTAARGAWALLHRLSNLEDALRDPEPVNARLHGHEVHVYQHAQERTSCGKPVPDTGIRVTTEPVTCEACQATMDMEDPDV